jgi:DNA-binding YbaB/EbfC family protein
MKMPGGNMNQLMKQAKKLQAQMAKLEEEVKTKTVEATSGGGAVKVIVGGDQQLHEVQIDPEVIDAEDVEMLQDLVMAAVNEGLRKAKEMTAEEMGKITGGIMPNFPGL